MSESRKNTRNTKNTQNRKSKSSSNLNNKISKNINNFYNGMGNEITGLVLIGFGFLIFAGVFTNRIGKVGRVLRDVAFTTFGYLGYFFPILLIAFGLILIFRKVSFMLKRRTIGFILVITTACIYLSITPILNNRGVGFEDAIRNIASYSNINHGGIYGYIFALPFMTLFGEIGTKIFTILGFLLGMILLFNMTVYQFIGLLIELYNKVTKFINEKLDNHRQLEQQYNDDYSLPEINRVNLKGLKGKINDRNKTNSGVLTEGANNSRANKNDGKALTDEDLDLEFAKQMRMELDKRKAINAENSENKFNGNSDSNTNNDFVINNSDFNKNDTKENNEEIDSDEDNEESWITRLFGSKAKDNKNKIKEYDDLERLNNEILNSSISGKANVDNKKKTDFKFDAMDFDKESEKLIGDVVDDEEVIKAQKKYIESRNSVEDTLLIPEFTNEKDKSNNSLNNIELDSKEEVVNRYSKNYDFDLEKQNQGSSRSNGDLNLSNNINGDTSKNNNTNPIKNETTDSEVKKDIPKLRLEDLKPIEPIFEEEKIPEEELDKYFNDINPLEAGEKIDNLGLDKKENIKKNNSNLNLNDKSQGKNKVEPMKPLTGEQLKMGDKKNVVKKEYKYPPVELLKENFKGKMGEEEEKEIVSNAQKLQETLMSFGVEAKVLNVSRGPSVTRYELQPKAGIKVSKITNLADDIALSLAAAGVRIEAPIPGKAAVGIEIPNKDQRAVFLREVITSEKFQTTNQKLSIALGEDISGESVIGDMARFPHVLIAGATGSGKSVCINSLIVSLLYKYTPEEVRLIMVDPKVVELSVYNGIPHLLIPVVTDPKKATGALHWAVTEMTRRYQLFAENGVKNLEGYNALYEKGKIENKIPYIVIIVDELADLMMVAANEVEDYILRLSQMARAAGMHLVIATQRPSVDVITGVIKANIPSRISFAVSSYVDSKTILDQSGAEKLLGKGDMLYYPVGAQKPRRVQGAFISEEEVESIVEHIKESEVTVEYDESVLEHIESGKKPTGSDEDDDELMDDAIAMVVENNQASTSFLQRKLKIGYSRAARIMDSLEAKGVISGPDGSKPRRVIWKPEDIL